MSNLISWGNIYTITIHRIVMHIVSPLKKNVAASIVGSLPIPFYIYEWKSLVSHQSLSNALHGRTSVMCFVLLLLLLRGGKRPDPALSSSPLLQSANMADVETEATRPEPMASEEEPLLSNLDLFLFSLIAGLVIYWFMSRKKPEPIPDFKKIAPP